LHGGQSSSSKIVTPVTNVTGSDDISDAYFARDFGGWDMQVPTATRIAGPKGKAASWATCCRHPAGGIAGRLGWLDLQRGRRDNCSHPRAPCPWGAGDLSGSYDPVGVGAAVTRRDLQVIRSSETR
jgi:hypothetical protein